MIALGIAYLVVGYLTGLVFCWLEQDTMDFQDYILFLMGWPLLWLYVIFMIIFKLLPHIAAGKKI